VTIAEFADAAVSAAQQILVQVEDRHSENIAELFFETSRIGGDAAQLAMGRNQREPWSRSLERDAKFRCADAAFGKQQRAG
jgi:hypothetical protein